jgi:hypothetical protein
MNLKHPSFIFMLTGFLFFILICFLNFTCSSEPRINHIQVWYEDTGVRV